MEYNLRKKEMARMLQFSTFRVYFLKNTLREKG